MSQFPASSTVSPILMPRAWSRSKLFSPLTRCARTLTRHRAQPAGNAPPRYCNDIMTMPFFPIGEILVSSLDRVAPADHARCRVPGRVARCHVPGRQAARAKHSFPQTKQKRTQRKKRSGRWSSSAASSIDKQRSRVCTPLSLYANI
jgi:hypothetical protein